MEPRSGGVLEPWIINVPPVIIMVPLWLKFLSLSGARTGGKGEGGQVGQNMGGQGREVADRCFTGSPPQGETSSPEPVGVSESELGVRGVSNAVTSAQPITGDWAKWGRHSLREAPARTPVTEPLSPTISTLASGLCLSSGQAGRGDRGGFSPILISAGDQ